MAKISTLPSLSLRSPLLPLAAQIAKKLVCILLLILCVFDCLIGECNSASPSLSFDAPLSTRRPSSGRNYGSGIATEPPTKSSFRQTPRNITVSPGERAVMKCRVENLGTRMVTWRKRDEVHPLTIGLYAFTPDTRISVDLNQRLHEWTLTIQDVRPTDEGIYCCQISTKHDRDTYDIRLNVKTIQVSGTDFVDVGAEIKLMCNATGRPDPPHNVDWYKDGNRVVSNAQKGVIITKKIETKVLVSSLVIHQSQETDGGTYECRSSNDETGSFTVRTLSVTPSAVANRGPMKGLEQSFGRYSRGQSVTSHQQSNTVHLLCFLSLAIQLTGRILALTR